MKQDHKNTSVLKISDREIKITPNRFAAQANGSALVQLGDTVVQATAVMRKQISNDLDYFPLSVDYEENYWASGKIRGSRFMKRKGRPTDEAILTGRLIDRSIRPLFPKGMKNDVQIIISVLSYDFINDPRPLAMIAASVALEVSDIPFNGPLSTVHIGEKNNEFILFPTIEEQASSALSVFVSGVSQDIAMVEAGANEAKEAQVLEAFKLAQTQNKKISSEIAKIAEQHGKTKIKPELVLPDPELKKQLEKKALTQLEKIFSGYQDKKDYEEKIKRFKDTIIEKIEAENKDKNIQPSSSEISETLDEINKQVIRNNILTHNKRLGDRAMDEVRPLSIEISVLPRTHGSAVFTRGETQALTTTTLGAPGDELILDGMVDKPDAKQRYMHFYSFPPYCTGETGFMRGPGRREIGHGALGEKALIPVIPNKEKFPYTVILHTEIMNSDGSTSMASVCGSTLALMDAGVPITKPVAGVAMGLIVDKESDKYQVLTDLCANEDFAGHMDFKVAGTEDGITALQMDIKVNGLSFEILKDSLDKARAGRMQILEKIKKAISAPRPQLSKWAPRIEIIQIDPQKIGELIGPGGKMISSIIEKTGVEIDIEDDGQVFVSSNDQKSMDQALSLVNQVTKIPEIGEEYIGTVSRIMEFGAFIEFLSGKDGLVHISKLIPGKRVDRVTDVVKIGDKVKIRIEQIDNMGRYNLSLIKKL
ncbi:polyribonucleotide nucleotidyltransferase [Patescibacteria group bacterium]|nr:polyribonucleotide nucleotidyltransferase [Patescibacteria group bacterium]